MPRGRGGWAGDTRRGPGRKSEKREERGREAGERREPARPRRKEEPAILQSASSKFFKTRAASLSGNGGCGRERAPDRRLFPAARRVLRTQGRWGRGQIEAGVRRGWRADRGQMEVGGSRGRGQQGAGDGGQIGAGGQTGVEHRCGGRWRWGRWGQGADEGADGGRETAADSCHNKLAEASSRLKPQQEVG